MRAEKIISGRVAAWPGEAEDTRSGLTGSGDEHDRYRVVRSFGRERREPTAATITLTGERYQIGCKPAKRSELTVRPANSIRDFWPSTRPLSLRPGEMRVRYLAWRTGAAPNTPITGIVGCCARAASGHGRRAAEQRDELAALVAVGTCISWHAPRPDPYVRLSRIRLLPRVCDGTSCRIRSSACDTRAWF